MHAPDQAGARTWGRERKGREGKGKEEIGAQKNETNASVAEANAAQANANAAEQGTDHSTPASASAAPNEFDAFWKLYPKRKGANPKAPAERAFDAALCSGVAPSALLCAVKSFASAEAGKAGTEFIPMALTWLTQRRFEEYGPDPGLLDKLRAQAPMMRERGYELDEANLGWRKMGAAA